MNNQDNFEKYIKESLEGFEPTINLDHWKTIEKKLPKTPWYRAWYLPYIFSLLLFSIGLFIGYQFSKQKTNTQTNQTITTEIDSVFIVKRDTVFVKGEMVYSEQPRSVSQGLYSTKPTTYLRGNSSKIPSDFTNRYNSNAFINTQDNKLNNTDFTDSLKNHLSDSQSFVSNSETTSVVDNQSLKAKEPENAIEKETDKNDTLNKVDPTAPVANEKQWKFLLGTDGSILFPFKSNIVEQEITFIPSLKLSGYYRKVGLHMGIGFMSLEAEIDKPKRFNSIELEQSLPNFPVDDDVEDIDIYSTNLIFPASISFNLNNDKRNQVALHLGILGRYPLGIRYTYDYQLPGFQNQIEYLETKDFQISHYTMGINTSYMLSKNTDLMLGIDYYLSSSNFKTKVNRLNPINFNGLSLSFGLRFDLFDSK